ncbi:uncharacterized protein [Pyxicephalus adspersus]|uniref:uncharacterized protein n=1 Tax=Pyxicephalus adspersus TaxID=30357 RepID=UPI003B5B29FE
MEIAGVDDDLDCDDTNLMSSQRGIKQAYSQSGSQIFSWSFLGKNEERFYRQECPKSDEVLADWIIKKSKIENHNGELPLFRQGLLSTRKDEQLSGQSSFYSPKASKPWRVEQLFCRQAQSHRYLMATMSESSLSDPSIDLKPQVTTYTILLGRPTKSSLLRSAHQSACISRSIPVEHRLRKTSSEACSGKASKQKGLQAMSLEETAHSFLTGARYNRSCLDSQAFQKYGLFISKNQPGVSFLAQCRVDHQRKQDQSKEPFPKSMKIENDESKTFEKHSSSAHFHFNKMVKK